MPEVAGDALENPFALRPGVLVDGRYRVVRVLSAASSHAVVYAAFDEREQELVAIKELLPRSLAARGPDGVVLRPHSPADEAELAKAVKRFLREHDLLADLRHPALVRVRGTFAQNGTAYVVMDYVEAVPLERHARMGNGGGRMTIEQAVEFMTPLLALLETMHAEGLLHRDLSPATVHVDASARALLLAFPSRRFVQSGRDLAAGFAAIELYGTRSIGPWTDVYACAALLYFLVTGVVPVSAADRAAGQHLPPPNAIAPGISPALSSAITRGMGQLPEQRPHGIGELQRQLTAATSTATFAPATPSLPELGAPEVPPRAQPLTGLDIQAILAEETPRLKLSAGVVVPEDHGLMTRLRRWLQARKQQRTAAPEGAVTAQMTMTPQATVAPSTVERPPAIDPRPAMEAPSTPHPIAATPPVALDVVDSPLASIPQQHEPLAQWLESIRREARELEAAQREARERGTLEPIVSERDAEALEPALAELASEPAEVAPAIHAEASSALAELPGSETDLPMPAPAAVPAFGEETRRVPDLTPLARHRSSRPAVVISSLALLGIVVVSVANSTRAKPASPMAADNRATVGGTSTKQVAGPMTLPPVRTISRDSMRVNEAGGAVLQGLSPGGAAARTRQEREDQAPPTIATPDARAREALAAIQSSVVVEPTAAPRVVPPELLLDLRDRFSTGRQLAENGNYLAARQAFRAAVGRIDSLSSLYLTSEGLRALRGEIEQESVRVLAACNAENEIHRRRGGRVQPCG